MTPFLILGLIIVAVIANSFLKIKGNEEGGTEEADGEGTMPGWGEKLTNSNTPPLHTMQHRRNKTTKESVPNIASAEKPAEEISDKEDEEIIMTTKSNKKKLEGFNAQKAILYSEIMKPKFKDYQ